MFYILHEHPTVFYKKGEDITIVATQNNRLEQIHNMKIFLTQLQIH